MPVPLISTFSADPLSKVFLAAEEKNTLTISGAGNTSAKSLLIGQLLAHKKELAVWVVNDDAEVRTTAHHLMAWQSRPITTFVAEKSDESERHKAIRLIRAVLALNNPHEILITTYRDAQVKLPNFEKLKTAGITLRVGEAIDRTWFFNDLIARGYENVESPAALLPATYCVLGSTIHIQPPESDTPVIVELDGVTIERILWPDQSQPARKSKIENRKSELILFPVTHDHSDLSLIESLPAKTQLIADEVIVDEEFETDLPDITEWLSRNTKIQKIIFTSFPEEETNFAHLRFLSVLKYVTLPDLLTDLRTKKEQGWRVVIATKQPDDLKGLFADANFLYADEPTKINEPITLITYDEKDFVPQAFQNPEIRFAFLTDREIFGFQRSGKTMSEQKVYLDFITSLRNGDYVVHIDHGIAIFRGIEQKTVDDVTREYLRLDYAAGDKLFVPIDQAEKVNRFIGTGDTPPKLTRLGSAEWTTVQKRVASETEKIAKDLLALYAARAAAKGLTFPGDGPRQVEFESRFPYEETPGQIRAIQDVKHDMEGDGPMDRLVCGDVGFGKTEVALRAAFKAAMAGKQVAFISPITILADQHYQSCKKRLEGFDVTCEMLSRFKSVGEQKKILTGLASGAVQIVIGTHRLLQPDVKFKDLGLVIIDEEQRFGVKQKEALKKLRNQVDILTMSATPIPRTLNMALNKLRDITTITTPPPGRLPIVTEVRHFSWKLIADTIRFELARKGQVYFLHNRVATIEGVADRLRELIPEARFVVTHGQLKPDDLEERIIDFKDGKYDVLVSSAIIENGIDLPNANTLIVNNAEGFGLSQLYQLRGRVGRSRTQAYAYFLYQTKALKTDAKKRLRAIVEASELGSGFEIAMKDLEIRGAGEILGSSQSGAINTIGVSHFVRVLNQAVEDLKSGKQLDGDETSEKKDVNADVTLELPLTAFIPVDYISDTKDKIRTYQRISSADSEKTLDELKNDLNEEYGRPPLEVLNLFKVLRLKLACRRAGVLSVKVGRTGPKTREAVLLLSSRIKPAHIMSALALNPKWLITGDKLKIDIAELGVDWMVGLQKTVEALQTEYRNDIVKAK